VARQVFTHQVTIPAGTPMATPLSTAIPLPQCIVRQVEFLIPDGCSGQVGFAIGAAGQAVIPYAAGSWIVGNGETIVWQLDGQIDSGAWEFFAFNTGAFDHTIYSRFLVDPIATVAVSSGVTPLPAAGLSGSISGSVIALPVSGPAYPPPPAYSPPPPVATAPPPAYSPPPPVATAPPPAYTPPPPVATPPPPAYTPPGTGLTPGSGAHLSPVPSSALAPAAKTANFTVESPGGWWHDPNDASCQWLQRTGHYLCHGFSDFYWHNGGGATFGGPISEEFHDPTSGAQSSQEFERGRMEWWPGSRPTNYDVWWLAGS
jgi:hypothetical protein